MGESLEKAKIENAQRVMAKMFGESNVSLVRNGFKGWKDECWRHQKEKNEALRREMMRMKAEMEQELSKAKEENAIRLLKQMLGNDEKNILRNSFAGWKGEWAEKQHEAVKRLKSDCEQLHGTVEQERKQKQMETAQRM